MNDDSNKQPYLAITHINKWSVVHGFKKLEMEKFAIKVEPGTDHGPGNGRPAGVISKHGCLHAAHEERCQLHTARQDQRQLVKEKTSRNK